MRAPALLLVAASALAGLGFGEVGAEEPTRQAALELYGSHAGRLAATVPFCGGSAEEEVYFRRQVRELAEKAGVSPEEWAVVETALDRAKAVAKPVRRDCSEDGAFDLSVPMLTTLNQLKTIAR